MKRREVLDMKFESTTHYQRFMLGIICGLLPPGCLLFGFLGELAGINHEGWYNSISATYFCNANMCMIGALCLCAFFLFAYKGYDLGDRVLTMISAVSALLIVACPCDAIPAENLGLFALPAKISSTIHDAAASVLFVSFALMILTQFTKGNQKRNNTIYRICGWTMVAAMALVVAGRFFHQPAYMTMVYEFVMLEAFAVAWIVKSGAFQIKEEGV
jgi:hypothetical protein